MSSKKEKFMMVEGGKYQGKEETSIQGKREEKKVQQEKKGRR